MKKIVKAIAHWFWILILCALVGWFGGKELSVLIPPTYQATALVQLNAQAHTSTIVQPVAAYSALITSDSILGTALKNYPKIDRTALMTKQLTVTPDNSSQTISINVTLPDAAEAADIANELAQLLVKQQNAVIQQEYTKELQIVSARIKNEQLQVTQLNQKIIATPSTDTTTIQQLQSQVQQVQNLENQDITSQQTLTTQNALYSSPLSVVQSAAPPTKPSSIIGTIPLTPVFLVVMLLLGIFIIYMLERAWGRINDVQTLQKRKIVPILGALEWSQKPPQEIPLDKISQSKAPYAEECRVMTADILFHSENTGAHTLAITSIRSKAGNSSIAAELAALLANSKRRVLLVDANLPEPTLHKRLGIANEAGLAMLLEEAHRLKIPTTPLGSREPVRSEPKFPEPEAYQLFRKPMRAGQSRTIDETETYKVKIPDLPNGSHSQPGFSESTLSFANYIIPTRISNLYAVPAGKTSISPASLLSMPEMNQFLAWAAQRGDYIVIDCPALASAEAHVLSALSDQTFLVVDAVKDRIKQVESIRQELLDTGIKLSGYIINKLGRWI